jgi:hypothetical protein
MDLGYLLGSMIELRLRKRLENLLLLDILTWEEL